MSRADHKNASLGGRNGSMAALQDRMPQMELAALHHRTPGAHVDCVGRLEMMLKTDLHSEGRILVTTRNSTYSIHVLQDDLYSVSGGWLDTQGVAPSKAAINGSSWGGRAIKRDIVAACALHLEFGSQLVTARIAEFQVIHCREDLVNGAGLP
jgi:hypothetical protein